MASVGGQSELSWLALQVDRSFGNASQTKAVAFLTGDILSRQLGDGGNDACLG